MRIVKFGGALSLLLAVAACVHGPAYQPPSPVVSAQLHASLPPHLPRAGNLDTVKNWWTQFDDPLVAELVDAGQAGSPMLARMSDLDRLAARTGAGMDRFVPGLGR